jgi:hypothetical protein
MKRRLRFLGMVLVLVGGVALGAMGTVGAQDQPTPAFEDPCVQDPGICFEMALKAGESVLSGDIEVEGPLLTVHISRTAGRKPNFRMTLSMLGWMKAVAPGESIASAPEAAKLELPDFTIIRSGPFFSRTRVETSAPVASERQVIVIVTGSARSAWVIPAADSKSTAPLAGMITRPPGYFIAANTGAGS